ncbi:hypothetical protein C8R44DRAFT_811605 [Mycena epipterygia]|nr:hypothetical protein C8R44DRAFT_811605 [Mycena epipterygia]
MLATASLHRTPNGRNPTLPLELEREIFELTARVYPKMAPILLRVAQRVHTWIEPLLYETLILRVPESNSSHMLALLKSKPTSFLYVRNLLLDDSFLKHADHSKLAISACSKVQDLALFNPRPSESLLSHLAAMKLQRLMVRLDLLFGHTSLINFTLPVFATITHLDTRLIADGFVTGLSLLPVLTHLCLFEAKHSDLNYALLNCKKSNILINTYRAAAPLAEEGRAFSITDPRLVLTRMLFYDARVKDWELGAQGGCDSWARADLFVAKKRRGEIQPASRCWIEASDMIF